jgi:hypothetical protein
MFTRASATPIANNRSGSLCSGRLEPTLRYQVTSSGILKRAWLSGVLVLMLVYTRRLAESHALRQQTLVLQLGFCTH